MKRMLIATICMLGMLSAAHAESFKYGISMNYSSSNINWTMKQGLRELIKTVVLPNQIISPRQVEYSAEQNEVINVVLSSKDGCELNSNFDTIQKLGPNLEIHLKSLDIRISSGRWCDIVPHYE